VDEDQAVRTTTYLDHLSMTDAVAPRRWCAERLGSSTGSRVVIGVKVLNSLPGSEWTWFTQVSTACLRRAFLLSVHCLIQSFWAVASGVRGSSSIANLCFMLSSSLACINRKVITFLMF